MKNNISGFYKYDQMPFISSLMADNNWSQNWPCQNIGNMYLTSKNHFLMLTTTSYLRLRLHDCLHWEYDSCTLQICSEMFGKSWKYFISKKKKIHRLWWVTCRTFFNWKNLKESKNVPWNCYICDVMQS